MEEDSGELQLFRAEWLRELQKVPQEDVGEQEKLEKAIELHLHGLSLEDEGQLSEAIMFYRRATKLVPNIDHLYSKRCRQVHAAAAAAKSEAHAASAAALNTGKKGIGSGAVVSGKPQPAAAAVAVAVAVGATTAAKSAAAAAAAGHPAAAAAAAAAAAGPQGNTRAEPTSEDSEQDSENNMPGNEEHPEILPNHPPTGTHISTLPHDLLVLIFSFLVGADQDLATLRGTLLTCRAFSAAIRSESLWARIAAQFWPGTLQLETWPTWQAMVTTRPRVLFYGVYISKVSYMRQGEQNMMQTYRPCALVEYYRYLRLRTDGTAISVVTHEPPAAVVARMGSEATAARAFGVECLLGTWQRDGDAVHVLLDRANTYGTWRSDMSLHIVPAGPRPNARLKWMAYTLAKLPDGVPEPLTLNDHYRPFVFSRVRHFAHHSEPPVQ